MEAPNIDEFIDSIVQTEDNAPIGPETLAKMKQDIRAHLIDQITQSAIVELSDEKVVELTSLVNNPDFTDEKLTDFLQNSGVDINQITLDTMNRFQYYYLGAEA